MLTHAHTDTTAPSAVNRLIVHTVSSVTFKSTTPTGLESNASSVTEASLVLTRWRIMLRVYIPMRGHSSAPSRDVIKVSHSTLHLFITLRYMTCMERCTFAQENAILY